MPRFFLDASALIKRYSHEPGSFLVNELFRHATSVEMACATIGVLEVVSILTRKRNDGRLPEPLFAQAMANFKAEVLDAADFSIAPLADSQVLTALPLITRHNLNATDAILLRAAMDMADRMEFEILVCDTGLFSLIPSAFPSVHIAGANTTPECDFSFRGTAISLPDE